MGYTTDFYGEIAISPKPSEEFTDYINRFSGTRRMKRNPKLLPHPDAVFNGDPGLEGGYYAYDDGNCGQTHDQSVLDYNRPPAGQPGLWCQWVINDSSLVWDGGEKFYSYVEWLQYLIRHFFKPMGYTLNGKIEWQGEDRDDHGVIVVKDNQIMLGV